MLNKRIMHIDVPERMRGLAISDEGYPIPWFVPYVDGKPEFRAMDSEKMGIAVRHNKCWLCGHTMGVHLTFPIGPMCVVTRTTSEPPSHLACAEYGAKACPFLTQPRMRRNEKDKPEGEVAGIYIDRNPGCVALWTCRDYKPFRDHMTKGILFRIGDPEHVEYYANGRRATRDEILLSMETGLPILLEIAARDGPDALSELEGQYERAMSYVPTT